MDKLIKHNLRWVISIAKKFQNRGLTMQDLVQIGLMGLYIGIQKFDIKRTHKGKPLKLSTYVTWWIRQAISRDVMNFGSAIRKPISIAAEYTFVQILFGNFASQDEEGRRPNVEELEALYQHAVDKELERFNSLSKEKKFKAKKPKLKPKTAKDLLDLGRLFMRVDSLDVPNSEDENLTLLDYLCEEEERQPENLIENTYHKDMCHKLLETLPLEDAHFISTRFGFLGLETDIKSMAAMKKISEKKAKEKEKEILLKLKDSAEAMGFSLMDLFKEEDHE